jgi:hypothetical protein
MPTPSGLPKVGEVWERHFRLPARNPDAKVRWEEHRIRFVVLERGTGTYWSLRVYIPTAPEHHQTQLWVDASYWKQQGQLHYIGPAGPETRKKLSLG